MLENGGTLTFPPGVTCTTEEAFGKMMVNEGRVEVARSCFGPYPPAWAPELVEFRDAE